jgi:DNA-binding IscR family transcriptional regulator
MSLRDAVDGTSNPGSHGGNERTRTQRDSDILTSSRALEGPIAPMICDTDDPEHATACDRTSRCTVNVLWVRIRDAISSTLDSMSLADLVPQRIVLDPEPITTTPGALITP